MPRSTSKQTINREPFVTDPTWANWESPITVEIKDRGVELLSNPAEALSFLSNRWTGDRDGEDYTAARKACSEVLRRRLAPEEARLLFLKFAAHAGLLANRAV